VLSWFSRVVNLFASIRDKQEACVSCIDLWKRPRNLWRRNKLRRSHQHSKVSGPFDNHYNKANDNERVCGVATPMKFRFPGSALH